MLKRFIVATALLAPLAVHAAGTSESALRGKFAFDWRLNPSKTKCTRVSDQLMSTLMSARFNCARAENTASGVPALVCSAAKKGPEYMIFDTMAACEDERKTQEANGD